jgi:importin subunit beta-1
MTVLLQLLHAVGSSSSVPDVVFGAVGTLATALEEDFAGYMESFSQPLYAALGNQDEPGLCSMAIGLVSDITRSLGELSQPYCDTFMNYLLNNLRVRALLGIHSVQRRTMTDVEDHRAQP